MIEDVLITQTFDIDLLMKWRMEVLHCVFSIPTDRNTDLLEHNNREYYQCHLNDQTHIACLASINSEVIGCGGICFYNEMPSPDNQCGKCAYLMNIYVRENYRRKGVAKRIVRWLIDQALEQDITKIYLETSDEARLLYSDLGFSYMNDMMKFKIE